MRLFRRPFTMLARHWVAVTAGIGAVVGFCACRLWIARQIGETVDALGESRIDPDLTGEEILLRSALWLITIIVAEAVLRYLARRWIIDSSRKVEARLRRDLMGHMSRLPLTWHDRASTGDLLSRMTQDVELLRFLIGPVIMYGCQALVIVPGAVILMTNLSPSVTLPICGVFALLLATMAALMPRLQKYSKRVQEGIAAISQHAQESFSGIAVVLSFAKVRGFTDRFAGLNEQYVEDNMAMTRFRALVNLAVHTCTDLVLLAVLVLGALEVIEGNLTTGELFQFLILLGLLVWPLMAIGMILGIIHRAHAAAVRIEEVFDATAESTSGTTVDLESSLRVDNLTFGYEDVDRPALENISFSLPAGAKLGLVGPVGAGKSTLMHLVLRLYDPPRGTIFVGGHDILDLDLSTLRGLFAFAPQDPFLFSDTIEGNVRFGISTDFATDGSQTAIVDAVQGSALEQDISSLALGMDTVVGERGVALSGGQKQRVSLARALAANRSTIMLDDTLSAVDYTTESRILKSLRGSERNQTVIVASHRLSAVADADLILSLRNGRIVEQGDHATLLANGGAYAAAWRAQQESRALGGED